VASSALAIAAKHHPWKSIWQHGQTTGTTIRRNSNRMQANVCRHRARRGVSAPARHDIKSPRTSWPGTPALANPPRAKIARTARAARAAALAAIRHQGRGKVARAIDLPAAITPLNPGSPFAPRSPRSPFWPARPRLPGLANSCHPGPAAPTVPPAARHL